MSGYADRTIFGSCMFVKFIWHVFQLATAAMKGYRGLGRIVALHMRIVH
jgi:hypothetical protein